MIINLTARTVIDELISWHEMRYKEAIAECTLVMASLIAEPASQILREQLVHWTKEATWHRALADNIQKYKLQRQSYP